MFVRFKSSKVRCLLIDSVNYWLLTLRCSFQKKLKRLSIFLGIKLKVKRYIVVLQLSRPNCSKHLLVNEVLTQGFVKYSCTHIPKGTDNFC